jgi:hypothetical protein
VKGRHNLPYVAPSQLIFSIYPGLKPGLLTDNHFVAISNLHA